VFEKWITILLAIGHELGSENAEFLNKAKWSGVTSCELREVADGEGPGEEIGVTEGKIGFSGTLVGVTVSANNMRGKKVRKAIPIC
jgi:hypothetical protein